MGLKAITLTPPMRACTGRSSKKKNARLPGRSLPFPAYTMHI
ncbi:hypothetical protein KNP414_05455 [Paenibacillus mucilaginosus KNP414]|uniref:Uncharacterized protein n=1 Tax=Paenibacillus mucilaginosus (strain KNP414) TaxID=1036673 RepID=F8FI76_PAEMK|nr:hypothetical protein KNP414_05455 [Paenibacillus mucilaginosus KNP414]